MASLSRIVRRLSALASYLLLGSGLTGCGYHMGFSKPTPLLHVNTISVEMFENDSLEALAGILVTNAVTDTIQRDGTFKLSSSSKADAYLRGSVLRINFSSIRPNPQNTYISSEIALHLRIKFEVVDKKTGKVLIKANLEDSANFNNETGNVQSARESALAYAAQKIAEDLQFIIMSS